MSYLLKLFETYENCKSEIGKTYKKENDKEQLPLLPMYHTTNNAQIEVTISIEGEFLRAEVIPKEEALTIIPCSEQSSSRTANPFPHPLHDKLKYVAGDFEKYTNLKQDNKDKKNKKDKENPYELYIKQLEKWVCSRYATKQIIAIYDYLKKGCLIEELLKNNILFIDDEGYIIDKFKGDEKDKPPIYKLTTLPSDAFVRFAVDEIEKPIYKPWRENECFLQYEYYYNARLTDIEFCYIKGENKPYTELHPAKIRHTGDGAKIISSNDGTNYTYRGKFKDARQSASVSYEVSQKAHNALKWLIDKQGFKNGTQVFVTWSTQDKHIPSLTDDSSAELIFEDEENDEVIDTSEIFAKKLNKKISGYKANLTSSDDIVVMGLDSATKGRMAVIYYKCLSGSDFLERLEHWYKTCSWKLLYEDKLKKHKYFYGTPSPNDIAFASYGNFDDKIKSSVREKIMRCILDDIDLPIDLLHASINRSSNPIAFNSVKEWNKTLSITCALYKKQTKGCYEVALQKERTSRDYLYGRLLAVADKLEQRALKENNEDRPTNALRYMNSFSMQPFKTWAVIYKAILPYKERLGKKAIFYDNLFSEIMSLFLTDDYINNKPLTGEYLIGFYCQRDDLQYKKIDGDEENDN